MVHASTDLGKEVFLVCAFERLVGRQCDKQDNADRPDVSREAIVLLLLAELWRHVARRAANVSQLLAKINEDGKAHVDDFDVVPVVDDDVLELQVAVHDWRLVLLFPFQIRVHIADRISDLPHEVAHGLKLQRLRALVANILVE